MSNGTILVVDDEAHIVQVVSLKLKNAGYDVLTAFDGEEAFETLMREPVDLVITDYQMPYMTGLELARSMSRHPLMAETPVLILTARGFGLDDSDLQIENVKEVLTKPFSPRGILDRVASIIALNTRGKSEAA